KAHLKSLGIFWFCYETCVVLIGDNKSRDIYHLQVNALQVSQVTGSCERRSKNDAVRRWTDVRRGNSGGNGSSARADFPQRKIWVATTEIIHHCAKIL